MKPMVAPSVLAANFANLGADIQKINQSVADWIHFDVMDGHFVPNISFGIPVCEAVKRCARKPLDVHLMIEKPENYLQAFKKAGADRITVHLEACLHLHRVVQQIRELGCAAGVALNPHTPVSLLEEILPELDTVLLMSVNPGFGGQEFIPATYAKIRKLKTLIQQTQSPALIEIDGGVTTQNAARLVAAGADVLVAGSFVFRAEDPVGVIAELKKAHPGYQV